MTRACVDCDRPIGQMRLRAVASAERCACCQEAEDYRDNLAGRGPLQRARDIAAPHLAESLYDDAHQFADRQGVPR